VNDFIELDKVALTSVLIKLSNFISFGARAFGARFRASPPYRALLSHIPGSAPVGLRLNRKTPGFLSVSIRPEVNSLELVYG